MAMAYLGSSRREFGLIAYDDVESDATSGGIISAVSECKDNDRDKVSKTEESKVFLERANVGSNESDHGNLKV